MIHCAAFNAPRAKPSRLRAVWRRVMVSAAESKPISCVPGCAPARLELTSIGARSRPFSSPRPASERSRRRILFCRVVDLPGPGAVFRLLTRAGARLRRPAGRTHSRRSKNSGSRPARCHVFSTTASDVVQMLEPAGGADDQVHAERGDALDILHHGRREWRNRWRRRCRENSPA